MLSDFERKLLRILWNLYHQSWARPDIARFCRLLGRQEADIRAALKRLLDAGHIEVRPGELRVIQAWEQTSPKQSNRWDKYK